MEKRRGMLYLTDDDYRRLASLSKRDGRSMNATMASLLWQADLPKRRAGEVIEFTCKRCGRHVWVDIAEALSPDTCPYPACGGALTSTGRWYSLIVGPVE